MGFHEVPQPAQVGRFVGRKVALVECGDALTLFHRDGMRDVQQRPQLRRDTHGEASAMSVRGEVESQPSALAWFGASQEGAFDQRQQALQILDGSRRVMQGPEPTDRHLKPWMPRGRDFCQVTDTFRGDPQCVYPYRSRLAAGSLQLCVQFLCIYTE